MSSLSFQSAKQLAKAIQDKQISSLELLEHYIERVERLNPGINAIIYTDFDNARVKAKQADEALARSESWGPLHGLPMTFKESFEITGMPTTSGFELFKDHVSTTNASVVDDLLNAGAIIFGKTNLPLLTNDLQSYNEIYGQSNNPWDVTTTPGGSSGGAAAALAAGLCGLEIGSDIGGSIRNPAHCCGVFGHKPSWNIISQRGHVPPLPGIYPGEYSGDGDISVAGPMSRSVEDLELVMDLIVKPKSFQATAWKIELPPARKRNLKDYKLGLWLDDEAFPIDTQVGDCMQATVDKLSKSGFQIVDKKPDFEFAHCHDVYIKLLQAFSSGGLADEFYDYFKSEEPNLKEDDKSYYARFVRGTVISHRDWMRVEYQRLMMRQQWADFFGEFDVLLCPVIPVTAIKHDHSEYFERTIMVNGKVLNYYDVMLSWAGLTCVSYLPATVVPVGPAQNGMPVGMQVVGPYLEDKTALHVARLIEESIGGFTPPPGFE
jgi:amidase